MAEVKKYETLSPENVKKSFLTDFSRLGYEVHPNGFSVTNTVNPRTLTFVNSSIAPFIPTLENNRNDSTFVIHDATVQPSIRLNSLDKNGLLLNPQWMTSFDMAGIISTEVSVAQVADHLIKYLTYDVGMEQERLHFAVNSNDQANLAGLLEAGIPLEKIHFLTENTQNDEIMVNWSYGVPGFVGHGITFFYVTNESQIINNMPHPDRQFLNIIPMTEYNNGEKLDPLEKPIIDVGFGIERLLSLLRGCTPFELEGRSELKASLVREAKSIFGVDQETDRRMLTLLDQIYTSKLLLEQGIRPLRKDVTNRGPLLRKLIRNAILQASLLNINPDFLIQQYPDGDDEIIRTEVNLFRERVDRVESHLADIRESWLITAGGQKDAIRTRFSSKEMIDQFLQYVKVRFNVSSEITFRLLKRIDKEAFYLSGFHERFYPYPTDIEEAISAEDNIHGIADLLKQDNLKDVLDLGAGTGKHSIALANQDFKVKALDFDPASIALLNEKVRDTGSTTITPILADGFHLAEVVGPESQDAVLIFYTSVLATGERMEDELTIRQIQEVLKPNGIFMWSVTNLAGVKGDWMPGDANLYRNNHGETVIYTEKREDLGPNRDRIIAHATGHIVTEPQNNSLKLAGEQLQELETYRFTLVETESERFIVYKDGEDNDAIKMAQIVSSDEGLLSIKPYTQSEVKSVLENTGFDQIEFHKGIKTDTFPEPSDGTEFDIVVTARKQAK